MTDEEIQLLKISNDMANEIIGEIKHVLSNYECMHGKIHESTPPMFFAELLQCIISKARMDGIEAGLMDAGIIAGKKPFDLKYAQQVWNKYLARKEEIKNEMEET